MLITKFRFFDPLKGNVPHIHYNMSAHNVLWRARSLVRGRSASDIERILEDMEGMLETYFDTEKHETIRKIERDGRTDLIEYDSEGRFSDFEADAYDEYDIRTKDTVSELDALEEAFDSFFSPDAIELEDVKEFEYFGSLALSMFEKMVERYGYEYNYETEQYEPKPSSKIDVVQRLSMTSQLFEALDCVGRGEVIKARDATAIAYQKKFREVEKRQSEIEKERAEQIREALRAELLEEEAERRKEASATRNDVRHQQNRDIRNKVTAWYSVEYRNFPSAAQAAKAFCQRLQEEGVEREQRTVENWLRTHAKQKGIRLT